MMRPLKTVLLLNATLLLCISCDPCRNLDCATDNYDGQFRIVNAADGKDLLFGPHKVYDKNEIKFYALKGTDTTFFEAQAIRFPGVGYDSILRVRFFPKADTAFIRFSNSDRDTLAISYKTAASRCCGTITKIVNFRYNNSADIPGDKGTQEIKK